MARANTESIEKQGIRRCYAGKQAPRASRKRLTVAQVMGGQPLMKLESKRKLKEWPQAEKAAHNAANRRLDQAMATESTKRKAHTLSQLL